MRRDPLELLKLKDPTDGSAIITAQEELSRADILRRGMAMARRLEDAGAAGSNVILSLDASPAFAATLVGCWFARCVPVLLDPLVKDELGRAVERMSARAVVRSSADLSSPLGDGVSIIVPGRDELPAPDGAPTIAENDPVLYLFTSGSTGEPSIVPKTFEHLHTEFRFLSGLLDSPKRVATLVPWCHILGLVVSFITPLGVGGLCDLSAGISPRIVLERARAGLLDVVVAVPAIYKVMNRLLERGQVEPFETGCRFVTSGAIFQPEARAFFEENTGATVIDLYGSTEAGGVAHRMDDGPWIPDHHVDWRVSDAGELQVRSGSVSLGSPGEFFGMGDLVRTEGAGFTLVGRADDVVKIGGRRLSFDEIITVMERCPGVERAMAAAEPVRGELRIVAWVEASDDGLTSEGVKRFVGEHLADHKAPRVVRFVDRIPVTPAGKVDRKMLEGRGAERG